MRLCAACAGASASSTHVCSAQYLQPPPYVPCVSARHLLCPSLAFPTSFCHLCLRKVSCALPQHVISSSLPSLPCAPYTTFPHALTLSPLLNVGRGPAPWPDKQLCVAVSSLCRCFKHSCLLCSVLATPAVPALRVCPPLIISFSCLSCALSNTWCVFLLPSRAYAICVCPTLGCSLSWFPHLGLINATRCEAVSSLPLALHSPRATLQPSWRVPIVSDRRLVRLSLAFTQLCHSCLPDTQLLGFATLAG